MPTDAVPERVLRARRGFVALDLAELWRFRELLMMFSWRDILVRYKQTYLGIAWAVLQPVLTTLVLTLIFGRFAKFPDLGVPYPLLVMAGFVPWQFFAMALGESSMALVASARIITKVYFPRLILPISAVLSGLLDALIGMAILFVLLLIYGVPLRPQILLLPFFGLLACFPAICAGLWFGALNVRYRDVRYIVPFLVRLGMYVTPVGFVWQKVVPMEWQFLYGLNPLVGIIDGFRWCLLGPQFAPHWPSFLTSFAILVPVFLGGLLYFRKAERTFADIV
jgi:lipopolysaccharide transport system permease protein